MFKFSGQNFFQIGSGLCQVRLAGAYCYSEGIGDVLMRIIFKNVQVKHCTVSGRELFHSNAHICGCQVHFGAFFFLWIILNRIAKIVDGLALVCKQKIVFRLSNVIDRRIHNNSAYPTFEGSYKIEFFYILKQLYKAILQNIFCLVIVVRIPSANSQHLAIEHLVDGLLAFAMVSHAAVDQSRKLIVAQAVYISYFQDARNIQGCRCQKISLLSSFESF